MTSAREIDSLKSTVSELRQELDQTSVEREEAVQKERSLAQTEILSLKHSIGMLRENMEAAKSREDENIQKAVSTSNAEIRSPQKHSLPTTRRA